MKQPLAYTPAFIGLFASLWLAVVCNAYLDIQYGAFAFEVGFWSILFGVTVLIGWRQRGVTDERGQHAQKVTLGIGLLLTVLVFIPMWGFPRAGLYLLGALQAAQNCVTTTRRQLHLGLLVSAVMVIFAASHFRADWTMLFYLIPYIIAVVFTLVSEQISRYAERVRDSSLHDTGMAGQGVAIAAATALILALGGILYLATPQYSHLTLASSLGQPGNLGFGGQEGGAGQGAHAPGGAGQGGNAQPGNDGLPASSWPSPDDMRQAAKRPGMPEWQSSTLMSMADLSEKMSDALKPLRESLDEIWKNLKEWMKEHRDQVLIGLMSLLALIILAILLFLLRDIRARTWLHTRFDYAYLLALGRHAPGTAGATQYYLAMERLFALRDCPRPTTATVHEFLREATYYRDEARAPATELTRLFESFRYGPSIPDPQELARMRTLYRDLFTKIG